MTVTSQFLPSIFNVGIPNLIYLNRDESSLSINQTI